MKKFKWVLFGLLSNYIFTAIYQPFISPITGGKSIENTKDFVDYLDFLVQIPLAWIFCTLFIPFVFFSYWSWAIERSETLLELLSYPPISVSLLLAVELIIITYLLLSGQWGNLQTRTKFCFVVFASLCFNLISLDACSFVLRA